MTHGHNVCEYLITYVMCRHFLDIAMMRGTHRMQGESFKNRILRDDNDSSVLYTYEKYYII